VLRRISEKVIFPGLGLNLKLHKEEKVPII